MSVTTTAAGAAKRMPEGNGPSVHVDLLRIETKQLDIGESDRECLVQFNEVHLVHVIPAR